MSIFDGLPKPNKCCFCISLKWGSVIIGALGIINLFSFGYTPRYQCYGQDDKVLEHVVKYFFYVVLVSVVALFVASIAFLIGIFMYKSITATIFLYVAFISSSLVLMYSILKIVASITHKECPVPYLSIISAVILFAVWIYFIAVVNSFQTEMEDDDE